MASCTECVHVEVCRYYTNELAKANGIPLKLEEVERLLESDDCENFKNRARFVELPCHTGEKVWVTYLGRKGAIRSEEKGEVIGFFITSSLRVCASVILEDGSTFTGIYGKNVFPRKEELGKEKKCLIEK